MVEYGTVELSDDPRFWQSSDMISFSLLSELYRCRPLPQQQGRTKVSGWGSKPNSVSPEVSTFDVHVYIDDSFGIGLCIDFLRLTRIFFILFCEVRQRGCRKLNVIPHAWLPDDYIAPKQNI